MRAWAASNANRYSYNPSWFCKLRRWILPYSDDLESIRPRPLPARSGFVLHLVGRRLYGRLRESRGPAGNGRSIFVYFTAASRLPKRYTAQSAATSQGKHMKMHPIQCKCGTLRGQLDCAGTSNRVICYCTDCRAFAKFLGRSGDILDEQGGTEIVQVAQPRLTLLQGADRLAAVRLSEKGMVRWYAACCKTPLGNTMASAKVGFIGMIHSSLERSQMDKDFGSSIALLNTANALGDMKPKQSGLIGVIARVFLIVITTRISGRYRKSQLFESSGSPKVQSRVLTPQELESLKSAV